MKIGVLASVALLAFAAPAYAQEAPLDTYGGAGNVLDETTQDTGDPGGVAGEQGGARGETEGRNVRGVTTDTPTGGGGGTLPFTGADLTLMLLGGLALLGVGLGVRRVSRAPA